MSNGDETLLPLIFLSYFRRGLGAGIKDALFQSGLRAAFPVNVTIEGDSLVAVEGGIEVYGPADVIGIDPGVVIHSNPLPGVDDHEPNYMPHIEFDAPDFPWRFTPAEPDGQGRLRPWLYLITLAEAEFEYAAEIPEPLPVIRVHDPGSCLPNLSQSWAWAHVQVTDNLEANETIETLIETLLETAPEQVIVRLISPRRLEPHTTYHAFLVPTTQAGRLAGLGREPGTDMQGNPVSAQDLAWIIDPNGSGTTPGPLDLPVY